jgi:hypothetical protein
MEEEQEGDQYNKNNEENLKKISLQNFSNINNKLNGNNFNDGFIEKMFNENYNYKIEISNLYNKLDQYKADNEKLKNKLKKCILQSDFLEKKLESYKISNGSNSYLFSNNNNMNCSNSFMKQQNDFERLYYEKCEELENFEQNFNKISEKFSDVLSKIQHYQFNLIEDNKRLKEFLIFILQCFNHKQYEHINCIVNYAKENKTFLDKQIFEMPVADSFKDIEKNYFEKSSLPENDIYSNKDKDKDKDKDKIDQISKNKNEEYINNNNNKDNNKKFSGYFSTEENEDQNQHQNSQQKNKSNKTVKFDYQNLKFSKTVNEKLKLNNKAQSIDINNNMNLNMKMNSNINSNNKDLIELNVSNNSINIRNKSPIVTSSTRINIENEKSKDFSYSSMVRKKYIKLN